MSRPLLVAYVAAISALAVSAEDLPLGVAAFLLVLKGPRLRPRPAVALAVAVAAIKWLLLGTASHSFIPGLFSLGEILALTFALSRLDRLHRYALALGTLICAGNTEANPVYFVLVMVFAVASVAFFVEGAALSRRGRAQLALALLVSFAISGLSIELFQSIQRGTDGWIKGLTGGGLDFAGLSNITPLNYGEPFLDSRKIVARIFTTVDPHLLRGRVYTHYANGAWQGKTFPVSGVAASAHLADGHYRFGDAAHPSVRQRVLLEGGPSLLLYLPENATLVRTDLPYLAADRYGVVFHLLKHGGRRSYEVLGEAPRPDGLSMREVVAPYYGGAHVSDDEMLRECLEVPAVLSPAFATLSRQVAGGGDDASKARAVQSYLQRNYRYSLGFKFLRDGETRSLVKEVSAMPIPWVEKKALYLQKHRDGVEDFVLNHRAAHCELFASAMTLMLREAGVSARYVVGFLVREHHDGYYVVRESDAHAWCEVYLKGQGWFAFDPTPPGQGLRPVPPESLFDRLSEWLDLEYTRMASAISLGGAATAASHALLPVALIGAAWLTRKRWRFRLRWRAAVASAPPTPFDAILRELERIFKGYGSPNQTPRERAALLEATPEERARLIELVDRFYRLRYGEGRPSAEACRELHVALRGMGDRLCR